MDINQVETQQIQADCDEDDESNNGKRHHQKPLAKRLWVSLKDTWTGVLFSRTGDLDFLSLSRYL